MPIDVVELPAGSFVLRPPRPEDEASDTLAMLSDPDTRIWNPAPAVVDLASAATWAAQGADWSDGTHATFSIVTTDGGFVGNVSLYAIDLDDRAANIGYRVGAAHRGRGAATSAVAAVSEWAYEHLGLFRLQLFHAVDNSASCRVAEKARYQLEATLRLACVNGDGVRRDQHLHARLVTD